MKVIIDTNVLVAGTRSKKGAAFKVLSKMIHGKIKFFLSIPLFLEYEEVLKREEHLRNTGLDEDDVDALLNVIALNGITKVPYFLWRPILKDPRDEFILELAIVAGVEAIITFNINDFLEATMFGIKVMTPYQFLEEIKI